ncbi:MAG: class I SAM-dependent rRNA methyltransferase [Bdellovibrionales bacterium CG10_big_fil_rev_8_21_14_0_10_45_34]|nr:MAG: class I SAM-dependent rRNA methyltransferase [Bdellovibrionales bacterium CG10_big_fil_rev_8_21_14_0_10_45_34]
MTFAEYSLTSNHKTELTRNLRKTILRGHPWVYRDSIEPKSKSSQPCLTQVFDSKGFLAWAIYDPQSVIGLRILSLDSQRPDESFFRKRFRDAMDLRKAFAQDSTNSYRLLNGEGDLLPGLVCDIYNEIAVVQFDGPGMEQFWPNELISKWLVEVSRCTSVVHKRRRGEDSKLDLIVGSLPCGETEILENGARFLVDIASGQKTGFFFDQRENRKFVRSISKDTSVLNIFSYTGGFSVSAGLGGARSVTSVDIANGAIDLANRNWILNGLDPKDHMGVCQDAFDFLASTSDKWCHVIVDPPSMSHSEDQKSAAIKKYIDVFAMAAKRVISRGGLSLSSCSSHVDFEDFTEIINETLSRARRTGQIMRVSGQASDHPYPHACPELRYLKFAHLILN